MVVIERADKGAPLAEELLKSLESADLSTAARTVAHAAIMLMDACDKGGLAAALDANLRMWAALKTMAKNTEGVSPRLRDHLLQLAEYVSRRTLRVGHGTLDMDLIASLAGINLQIASGFVDAARQEAIRGRAEQLWKDEGCPQGRDQEHWFRAERELFGS